jgi:hypothetical protein
MDCWYRPRCSLRFCPGRQAINPSLLELGLGHRHPEHLENLCKEMSGIGAMQSMMDAEGDWTRTAMLATILDRTGRMEYEGLACYEAVRRSWGD